jgi:hypothetical protein
MPDTMMIAGSAPARDLCPALRNVRLRLRRHLAVVEKEIATAVRPAALRDERAKRLLHEREQLLEALKHVASASERGLAPAQRIRELESLLDHLPDCVTAKARARVRLLIEGLDSGA